VIEPLPDPEAELPLCVPVAVWEPESLLLLSDDLLSGDLLFAVEEGAELPCVEVGCAEPVDVLVRILLISRSYVGRGKHTRTILPPHDQRIPLR